MNRRPPEPLDSEERLLAEQLARLGPHGEPSVALDARILAAAHDAVAAPPATPRRPRWPVAMGLAASALLAVGIAWQLRPVDEMRSAEQVVALPEARIAVIDPPAAADAAAAVADEQTVSVAQQAAPVPPVASSVSPIASKPAAAPRRVPAEHPAAHEPVAPARRQAPAPEVAAATEPAPPSAFEYARPAAAAPAPPAPPPPAATARADGTTLDSIAMPSASVQSLGNAPAADRPGFVAAPETTAAIAAKREKARAEQARDAADAAEASRSGAEARARNPASPKATTQPAPPPPALTASVPVAPAPASATRNALKRTDLQLPVVEDTKLPPEDWLERIRLRRDLGDRASAVDSLVRFKQNHPFQKIPDDLKELLGE